MGCLHLVCMTSLQVALHLWSATAGTCLYDVTMLLHPGQVMRLVTRCGWTSLSWQPRRSRRLRGRCLKWEIALTGECALLAICTSPGDQHVQYSMFNIAICLIPDHVLGWLLPVYMYTASFATKETITVPQQPGLLLRKTGIQEQRASCCLPAVRDYKESEGSWVWAKEQPPSGKTPGGGDTIKKLKKKVSGHVGMRGLLGRATHSMVTWLCPACPKSVGQLARHTSARCNTG